MKPSVKNYLSISKKEWNGMVVLVIVLLLVLASPYIYQQLLPKDNRINLKDFNKDAALLQSITDTSEAEGETKKLSDAKPAASVKFYFDPNDMTLAQWQQLGLSERQAHTIINYVSKGGHFYRREDLKKIYGITAEDYNRLEPFITLSTFKSNKVAAGVVVEINSADSARLTQLHGVGPAFAQRIIQYRTRLGGFLNKEQLKEIYGIDTTKYAQLKAEVSVNAALIKKIKINEVDFEELRVFPYLTNKQTNAIIQYRKQHGDYHSTADLKNIVILDDDILRKIEPYLNFK